MAYFCALRRMAEIISNSTISPPTLPSAVLTTFSTISGSAINGRVCIELGHCYNLLSDGPSIELGYVHFNGALVAIKTPVTNSLGRDARIVILAHRWNSPLQKSLSCLG